MLVSYTQWGLWNWPSIQITTVPPKGVMSVFLDVQNFIIFKKSSFVIIRPLLCWETNSIFFASCKIQKKKGSDSVLELGPGNIGTEICSRSGSARDHNLDIVSWGSTHGSVRIKLAASTAGHARCSSSVCDAFRVPGFLRGQKYQFKFLSVWEKSRLRDDYQKRISGKINKVSDGTVPPKLDNLEIIFFRTTLREHS
jgi:hypothetical protein